ncbi:hypothetical protein [Falsirhodobacter sp. 20TX0035]|uniref:hypothetical protein n=1 Tax=Falsirhodobacter sp. 20TX0035 TaxID=3022019 RepID=UPI00232D4E42|nr:hypothetical protein [Falsirhodobacter sp. 20TX0035]MDB6454994.1 hypothetical protein [Falsirhodobacter sp. 20TX0035]
MTEPHRFTTRSRHVGAVGHVDDSWKVDMRRIVVGLPSDMFDRINREAKDRNLPFTEVVRQRLAKEEASHG